MYYGSSRTRHNYGCRIMGSRHEKTLEVIKKIEDADKALHCPKNSSDLDKRRKRKAGQRSLTEQVDGVFKVIVNKCCLDEGKVGVAFDVDNAEIAMRTRAGSANEEEIAQDNDLPVVSFPRSRQYRVRTLLSLIHKSCELSGVDRKHVRILTIGSTLLREGVTVKTRDHQLAPTAMVVVGTANDKIEMNAVDAMQIMGRLCGPRSAEEDRDKPKDWVPTLWVPFAYQQELKRVYDHLEEMMEVARNATGPEGVGTALQAWVPRSQNLLMVPVVKLRGLAKGVNMLERSLIKTRHICKLPFPEQQMIDECKNEVPGMTHSEDIEFNEDPQFYTLHKRSGGVGPEYYLPHHVVVDNTSAVCQYQCLEAMFLLFSQSADASDPGREASFLRCALSLSITSAIPPEGLVLDGTPAENQGTDGCETPEWLQSWQAIGKSVGFDDPTHVQLLVTGRNKTHQSFLYFDKVSDDGDNSRYRISQHFETIYRRAVCHSVVEGGAEVDDDEDDEVDDEEEDGDNDASDDDNGNGAQGNGNGAQGNAHGLENQKRTNMDALRVLYAHDCVKCRTDGVTAAETNDFDTQGKRANTWRCELCKMNFHHQCLPCEDHLDQTDARAKRFCSARCKTNYHAMFGRIPVKDTSMAAPAGLNRAGGGAARTPPTYAGRHSPHSNGAADEPAGKRARIK